MQTKSTGYFDSFCALLLLFNFEIPHCVTGDNTKKLKNKKSITKVKLKQIPWIK